MSLGRVGRGDQAYHPPTFFVDNSLIKKWAVVYYTNQRLYAPNLAKEQKMLIDQHCISQFESRKSSIRRSSVSPPTNFARQSSNKGWAIVHQKTQIVRTELHQSTKDVDR